MNSALIRFIIVFLSSISVVQAAQIIRVGGYEFPPYVEVKSEVKQGLTLELIAAMNKFQSVYKFEFVGTSPKGRYKHFEDKSFDMLFFESKAWGWKDLPVDESMVFLKDGEVYIAQAKPGRDESWFADFERKTMVGVLGYHYGFAGFDSNEANLKAKFNMQLTTSNEGSIKMIESGRGDIGVVTLSFLNRYFGEHPDAKKQLLVSKKMDQEYNHTILVRKGFQPGAEAMNQLLRDMEKAGVLKKLWAPYGIDK